MKIESDEIIKWMDDYINKMHYRQNRWGMYNDVEKGMRSAFGDIYEWLKKKIEDEERGGG